MRLELGLEWNVIAEDCGFPSPDAAASRSSARPGRRQGLRSCATSDAPLRAALREIPFDSSSARSFLLSGRSPECGLRQEPRQGGEAMKTMKLAFGCISGLLAVAILGGTAHARVAGSVRGGVRVGSGGGGAAGGVTSTWHPIIYDHQVLAGGRAAQTPDPRRRNDPARRGLGQPGPARGRQARRRRARRSLRRTIAAAAGDAELPRALRRLGARAVGQRQLRAEPQRPRDPRCRGAPAQTMLDAMAAALASRSWSPLDRNRLRFLADALGKWDAAGGGAAGRVVSSGDLLHERELRRFEQHPTETCPSCRTTAVHAGASRPPSRRGESDAFSSAPLSCVGCRSGDLPRSSRCFTSADASSPRSSRSPVGRWCTDCTDSLLPRRRGSRLRSRPRPMNRRRGSRMRSPR